MTVTPPSDSPRQTFSKAWGAFARTSEAVSPSVADLAEERGDAVRETAHADAPVADAPAQEKNAPDDPGQRPLVGQRLSATVAASASISAQLKPGIAENCFNGLSYAAFLVLPLLLLAQGAVGYHALTPWLLPQEAHFAQTYELMRASGHWLTAPAPLPPAWFWMLRLLNTLPYVDGPVVYAAGAALAGVLTLLATWFLALSAGYDRRTAFASGLVLLSCLAFPALARRVGPELFCTGLLPPGLACLIRGWNKDISLLWLPLGFVCVALAGLAGGVFVLLLPVLGSLIFLTWKGAFARFNRADGAIGFAALLALPLAWLGAAMLFGPGDAHLRALCAQLIAPFLPPYWPPKDPVWLYAAILPMTLVPWILAPLFVSWGNVLARPFGLLASTRKENSGSAWIWIHLAAGLLLLSAMSSKFCLNALPLAPLLAIVLGKAIVNLPQANSRAFFLVLAGLFGLAALALGLAALAQIWPSLQSLAPLPYPRGFAAIQGLPILAGICLLTACILWKLVDRRFPGACLLVCAVAVTVLCLPALKLTTPGMQEIFLPAVQKSAPAAPAPEPPPVQAPAAEQPEAKVSAPVEKPAAPAEEKPARSDTPQPEEKAPAEEKPVPAAPQAEEKPAQNP
jgi:4-amino-4-deoxy-L-arabinose transferase-like glycosyltransferase